MERLRIDTPLRRAVYWRGCLGIIAVFFCMAGSCSAAEEICINDVNDLLAVSSDSSLWNKHFILTGDINLWGYQFDRSLIGLFIEADHPDNLPFTGIFDGRGHKISGFKITADSDGIGLFALLGEGSCVKNLFMEEVDIFTTGSFTGGITGVCHEAMICNCKVSGNINVVDDGSAGIAGENYDGTIKNCMVDCVLSGDYYVAGIVGKNLGGSVINCITSGTYNGNDDVGGIIGYCNPGIVSNCSSSADCTGDFYVGGLVGIGYSTKLYSCSAGGTARGNDYTGGLVGDLTFSSCRVENCLAAGDSYGRDFVGGLIGRNDGVVSASAATGNVSARNNAAGFIGAHYHSPVNNCYSSGNTRAENIAGGFIAVNRKGPITNCCSTGSIEAISSAGGFMGINQNGTVVACFWDICSSGWHSSAAGTGLCTMFMQDPRIYLANGWDLDMVWRFCPRQPAYPDLVVLLKMSGDISCPCGTEINDLLDLSGQWLSQQADNPADINNDNKVDYLDFIIMAQNWY